MRPGRAAENSRGHGRVELYLYPPSGTHRACNGKTLPLYEMETNFSIPGQFSLFEICKAIKEMSFELYFL